jgi:hypothetical protein
MIIVYGYEEGSPVAATMGIDVAELLMPADRVVRCAVDE